MASDSLDALRAEFVDQALREGLGKTETLSALRELGAGMGYERFSALWDVAGAAREADALARPANELFPAVEGLTAPTTMKIATDYLYTVTLEGAGGQTRTLNLATNDPTLSEADIVGEALRVANDRSRYSQAGGIPPGGWISGSLDSAWHRRAA